MKAATTTTSLFDFFAQTQQTLTDEQQQMLASVINNFGDTEGPFAVANQSLNFFTVEFARKCVAKALTSKKLVESFRPALKEIEHKLAPLTTSQPSLFETMTQTLIQQITGTVEQRTVKAQHFHAAVKAMFDAKLIDELETKSLDALIRALQIASN